jgi:nicotinamidase-related amidase
VKALLIIDMQRWMFRYPERLAQAPRLSANIELLATAFARAGLPVFQVDTIHKADRSTWSRLMRKHDYSCLIEGTPDVAPVDGFSPPHGAIRIVKTANSAFVGTDLDCVLRRAGIVELVLTGVFIDGCVGLTAADAAQRGYEVTFVEDAIGHTRAERREVVLNWLVSDYELNRRAAKEVGKQIAAGA